MLERSRCFLLSLSCVAGAVGAQNTLVVDAAGGPGSQFRDIQPAIDAAQDGDRILVRRGTYTPFSVISKGLSILGETGVVVTGLDRVVIRATGPTQDVVLTDLDIRLLFVPPEAASCAGLVLFERVTLGNGAIPWRFTDCADLRLSSVVSPLGFTVTRGRVTITDSRLVGGTNQLFPVPALRLESAIAQVSRCQILGQSQLLRAGPSAAIDVDAASRLTITGDGSQIVSAGSSQAGPVSGMIGSGAVAIDPAVPVLGTSGAPPFAPTLRVTVRGVPSLRVIGAPVGSQVELSLTGPVNEPYAVVLSIPDRFVAFPGIGGELGIGAPIASFAGVFGVGAVQQNYTVGAGLPPGFVVSWQAGSGDGAGGVQLSPPATYARTR